MEYDFRIIEKAWQQYWRDKKVYAAEDVSAKPKCYVLDMFPYPSGAGLHVGHPLGYIASDIYSRYKRHKGFNVLHPMGYDSFGLPAEQYAIQTGQHPAITTKENIARYREQLDNIGFAFDWDREVRTSSDDYYKWTQWIFIQLFHSWYNQKTNKAESIDTLIHLFETIGCNGTDEHILTGDIEKHLQPFSAAAWKSFSEKEKQDILQLFRLTYLSEAMVNWCPALGTVLANDEVKDGLSERGGHPVVRKQMLQWSMRITAYADRLLSGLDGLDWPESVKEAQRNWIGKSVGSSLFFNVSGYDFEIEVFTTRPDTVFGVSFVTLAPEHELVEKITTAEQKAAVDAYIEKSKNRSERERMADVKNISGVFTGAYVSHPFTGKQIPVWIGDYVLAGYGTGAVMAVPAHDTRDFAFATHFNLPISKVIEPPQGYSSPVGVGQEGASYDAKEGILVNSDFLNGLDVKVAIKRAIEEIHTRGFGEGKVNYRLRDAIFGRQRYWGEPIPIYYKDGVAYTLPESELPLILPEVDKYLPTEDGEPPLARAKSWVYRPTGPSQPSPEGRTSAPSYQTAAASTWPHLKELSRENRKTPTEAEAVLWKYLQGEQLGHKFRRQHVIGNNIADFVCLEKKLVIEVDGKYHDEQKEYDEARTQQIESVDFRVVRFTNDEVLVSIESVIEKIKIELSQASEVLPEGEDLGGASYPLETTTMPGWAGSSWYFLRYMDAKNDKEFAARDLVNYWQDVDLYIGGAEHATGHLLYVRFWTKFLYDRGFIPKEEPAKKLINQGMIQGVSSFYYILLWKLTSKEDFDQSLLPRIIVSKGLCDKFKAGENTTKEYISNYAKKVIESTGLKVSISDIDFTAFHVDVNIVENGILDIEAFKKWRKEYANAEFILEDGKYICGSEVEKMSKSKWNVVSPDLMIDKYGADTLRLYEMFLGPLEQSKPWNTNGISGVSNFLRKFWRLFHNENNEFAVSDEAPTKAELKSLHKTIKKVAEDIERFSFNTSVSTFMICTNELTDLKCNKRAVLEPLTVILAPYAPHIAEMLWAKLMLGASLDINNVASNYESVTHAEFPIHNEEYLVEDTFEYPVSFNGKTRCKIELSLKLNSEEVQKAILEHADVQKVLNGGGFKKVIVVPGRIVNIVV